MTIHNMESMDAVKDTVNTRNDNGGEGKAKNAKESSTADKIDVNSELDREERERVLLERFEQFELDQNKDSSNNNNSEKVFVKTGDVIFTNVRRKESMTRMEPIGPKPDIICAESVTITDTEYAAESNNLFLSTPTLMPSGNPVAVRQSAPVTQTTPAANQKQIPGLTLVHANQEYVDGDYNEEYIYAMGGMDDLHARSMTATEISSGTNSVLSTPHASMPNSNFNTHGNNSPVSSEAASPSNSIFALFNSTSDQAPTTQPMSGFQRGGNPPPMLSASSNARIYPRQHSSYFEVFEPPGYDEQTGGMQKGAIFPNVECSPTTHSLPSSFTTYPYSTSPSASSFRSSAGVDTFSPGLAPINPSTSTDVHVTVNSTAYTACPQQNTDGDNGIQPPMPSFTNPYKRRNPNHEQLQQHQQQQYNDYYGEPDMDINACSMGNFYDYQFPIFEGMSGSFGHSYVPAMSYPVEKRMSCSAPTTPVVEHPLGEHPSRVLFVRNINSSMSDEELRSIFETYGDIRSIYTASKQRGFVIISYYDIRDAKMAMRLLQHIFFKRRRIDIHYSIPKEFPSEEELNQGTLVVFNLDSSITNEEVMQVFSKCGTVKEIRETPNKKHHKFVEYYDVRDAERALRMLNKTGIPGNKGKKIKIEPSRPGGARKSMLQHQQQQQQQRQKHQFRYPSPKYFPKPAGGFQRDHVQPGPPPSWMPHHHHLVTPMQQQYRQLQHTLSNPSPSQINHYNGGKYKKQHHETYYNAPGSSEEAYMTHSQQSRPIQNQIHQP